VDLSGKQRFVVPYVDQGKTFWEKLSVLYREHIREVYFPLTGENIGTGRPSLPDKHLTGFLESGIFPVSVLINPLVLPRPVNEISGGIIKKVEYYLKNYNLIGVTLANLALAKIIRKTFPSLELTASTLMEISNEQQLVMIGDVFDRLVPPGRILRDIRTLKMLKKRFKGKIRIMVNEGCLPSCVFRTQHFYEMSNPDIAYPDSLCYELLEEKPWLRLTGGWILPQHLSLIEGLFDEIKLSGRISLQRPERYFRVLESYLFRKALYPHETGGGPASVNVPMDIRTDFFKYTLSCRKNCSSCKFCEDYWKKYKAGHE